MFREHSNVLTFVAAITVMALGLAVAIHDRVQVEQRLDQQVEDLADVQRQQAELIRANESAIERLARLEHPLDRDILRSFRRLLRAAREETPVARRFRRLVRRIVAPVVRQVEGGDRNGPPGGTPPGQPPGQRGP